MKYTREQLVNYLVESYGYGESDFDEDTYKEILWLVQDLDAKALPSDPTIEQMLKG